eukprot:634776-Prorocentrum_minimum.AAC.2
MRIVVYPRRLRESFANVRFQTARTLVVFAERRKPNKAGASTQNIPTRTAYDGSVLQAKQRKACLDEVRALLMYAGGEEAAELTDGLEEEAEAALRREEREEERRRNGEEPEEKGGG